MSSGDAKTGRLYGDGIYTALVATKSHVYTQKFSESGARVEHVKKIADNLNLNKNTRVMLLLSIAPGAIWSPGGEAKKFHIPWRWNGMPMDAVNKFKSDVGQYMPMKEVMNDAHR